VVSLRRLGVKTFEERGEREREREREREGERERESKLIVCLQNPPRSRARAWCSTCSAVRVVFEADL